MGKVVVTEFVSLDGVMEDPGGAEGYEHGGWTFTVPTAAAERRDKFKMDELACTAAGSSRRQTLRGLRPGHLACGDRRRSSPTENVDCMPLTSSSSRRADAP